MTRSGETVAAVRSLMRPGNPVPAGARVGSPQDLAGQQMHDLILTRAHSEVADAPSRRRGTRPQPAPGTRKSPGGWQRAAAPIAAALAVAGIVTGLVLVQQLAPTSGRHAGGAPAAAAADKGMPGLYVTLSFRGTPSQVVAEVHASRTGRVLDKVNVGPVNGVLPWVTADRSGRTFVIDAGARGEMAALYMLRVPGNGHSAKVTKLPINPVGPTSSHHAVIDGLALSPDGSKLAVALQTGQGNGVQRLTGTIRVYRLAGGAPRAWAAPGLPFSPVWTGASQLTFVWQDHLRGTDWFYTGRSQIRVLDTAGPGQNLLSSRVLVTGGGRLGFIQSALAGPGDSPIYAATFRVSGGTSGTASLQLAELSATGAVSKVFAHPTYSYSGQVQEGRVVARCQVLGIDATGQHALANCPSFGRIDHGTFTPLPRNSGDFSAAW